MQVVMTVELDTVSFFVWRVRVMWSAEFCSSSWLFFHFFVLKWSV